MQVTAVQHNEKFLRQRKMLLFLPFIVCPMLCLAFYGLGGGKGREKRPEVTPGKGLNMALPEARFDLKKKAMNKMGFYKQADQDSLRLLQRRKQDPFYNREELPGKMNPVDPMGTETFTNKAFRDTGWRKGGPAGAGEGIAGSRPGAGSVDGQAEDLLKKLDQLKGVLNQQAGVRGRDSIHLLRAPGGIPAGELPESRGLFPGSRFGSGQLSGDDSSVTGAAPGDRDLDKLSGMLDKILRIQHPEENRPADMAGLAREDRPVARLMGVRKEEWVNTLPVAEAGGSDTMLNKKLTDRVHPPGPGSESDRDGEVPGTGFFDLDDGHGPDSVADNAIEGMIARDQTLVSGESIELRLSQEAFINGVRIPNGNVLTGKATLSGERLLVTVNSIRVGNSMVPVSLEVVDLDGMAGIRERGSINRDVSKESAGEAINALGMTSLDPSLGAQAASAGLQAAKTLLGRKVRLIRVSVKAGYKVLLRNTKVN